MSPRKFIMKIYSITNLILPSFIYLLHISLELTYIYCPLVAHWLPLACIYCLFAVH